MMIGTKMTFWMHLGCLGGHLGAQKRGRRIPTCEKEAGRTPPGRGRGGVNPSPGTGGEGFSLEGSGAGGLHALRQSLGGYYYYY